MRICDSHQQTKRDHYLSALGLQKPKTEVISEPCCSLILPCVHACKSAHLSFSVLPSLWPWKINVAMPIYLSADSLVGSLVEISWSDYSIPYCALSEKELLSGQNLSHESVTCEDNKSQQTGVHILTNDRLLKHNQKSGPCIIFRTNRQKKRGVYKTGRMSWKVEKLLPWILGIHWDKQQKRPFGSIQQSVVVLKWFNQHSRSSPNLRNL